jgi:hypothetical protein
VETITERTRKNSLQKEKKQFIEYLAEDEVEYGEVQ